MLASKFMSLFNEKREKTERRKRNNGPPSGVQERRIKRDRRQTAISEISFQEWTRYFLKFKKHAVEKATTKQTAKVAKTAASQGTGSSPAIRDKRTATRQEKDAPDGHDSSTTPS
jgi:hypothetical protein